MDDIQRAIEFLQDEIAWLEEQKNSKDTVFVEVYKEIKGDERKRFMETAISAMQELQTYRATGLTPHMVETLKENDKRSHQLAVQRAAELDEYQVIGTPEECREAVKRQQAIPARKTTIFEGKDAEKLVAKGLPNFETFKCPKCGRSVEERTVARTLHPDGYIKHKFCRNCGQAIDWSDEEN